MKTIFTVLVILIGLNAFSTTYYVAKSDACASDSNDGLAISCTDVSGPLLSIEFAVTLLMDGDSILIGQGLYFEHPLIDGLQGITIMPFGDGMVTISGAMEEYTVPNNGLWTYEGMRYSMYHNEEFPVYYADYPEGVTTNASWNNLLSQNMVVDDNGRKMYTYADSVLFSQRYQPDVDGVYFDYDRVYISFQDEDRNPNDVGLFLSRFWDILYFTGGCTVNVNGGPDKLLTLDHGARYSVFSRSGSQVTMQNVIIKNGHNGFYEHSTAGSSIIKSCAFYGAHDSLWTWTGIKDCFGNPGGNFAQSGCYTLPDLSVNPNFLDGAKSLETTAIMLYGDTAHHIVRNCIINGYFNGIIITGGSGSIEQNEISNIYDDAIEPEGDLSLIIRKNKIWDAFVGHAGVTTEVGPVYSFENVYCANKDVIYSYDFINDQPGEIWTGRPMKFYGTSADNPATNTHFYFNTFYGRQKPLQVGSGGCSPNFIATNSSLFNNMFISESTISSNSGLQENGIEIRSNLFHTTDDFGSIFNCWNGGGSYTSLPPMPSSWTGNIQSDPLILSGDIDMPIQYFSISEDSPSREINGFVLEQIPATWPSASTLNAFRTNAGALEYAPSVGLDEDGDLLPEILLFPNPTNGVIRIDFGSVIEGELYVINGVGEIVYRQTQNATQLATIDLSGLATGVYILRVDQGDKVINRRIGIVH